MARTSRTGVPSNNLDALDNLDLDDMFAESGDALFDVEGLDVDLVGMEDLANSTSLTAADTTASPAPAPKSESGPKRRKTKRKTTAPTFFDDLDDEMAEQEPAKKKKRTSKAAPKRGGRGKNAAPTETPTAAAAATPAPTSVKTTKKTKKSTAASSSSIGTSASSGVISTPPSGVAAAGQFGGRQKKGVGAKANSGRTKATSKKSTENKMRPSLPMAANRTGAPLPPPPTVTSPPLPAPKAKPPTQKLPPPPQSLFCGLSPSNSVFYPFLPALPQEVSFKTRKMFTLLERVSASFTGALSNTTDKTTSSSTPHGDVASAKEDEPIFRLSQDAYKEDKNAKTPATTGDRARSIGTAIGVVRKTIAEADKTKLAHDLLNVCALLRRQHDFVKQNNANMERWCRERYSEEDFASVYQEGKKKRKTMDSNTAPETKPPVMLLSTFKVSEVKVKIRCSGFKEPKATLIASLVPETKRVVLPKAKKKEPESVSPAPPRTSSAAVMAAAAAAAATSADLPYMRKPPVKRRKAVSVLISRVAQAVESRHNQKIEQKRQAFYIQEKKRRDVAEDTSVTVLHTGGMWKYLQESKYFEEPVTDVELQDRVDLVKAMNVVPARPETKSVAHERNLKMVTKLKEQPEESLTDRLVGLLVNETVGSDSDTEDSDDDDDDDDEESSSSNSMSRNGETLLDTSELNDDQRALIQIRVAGLLDDERVDAVAADCIDRDETKALTTTPETGVLPATSNGTTQHTTPLPATEVETKSTMITKEEDSLESVIAAMTGDLQQINALTNARVSFVQKIARSRLATPELASLQRQREVSTVGKCAALLKRNKEAKAKAGKAKSKQDDDDLKLPW